MSTALRTYYRGANLVSLREHPTGQTRYYHSDYQGTTQCLTDSAGTVTDRFACDAWGVEVKRTGSSLNRQWYIGNWGYYRQVDQTLDYVRARWFAPVDGRWLSIDPINKDSWLQLSRMGDSIRGRYRANFSELLNAATALRNWSSLNHSYSYVSSSPGKLDDPSGLRPRTSPKEICPTCGHKVDKVLPQILNDIEYWFTRAPFWKQFDSCFIFVNPLLAPIAWDGFGITGLRGEFEPWYQRCELPAGPACNSGTERPCSNTVEIRGSCHLKFNVNYIMWGKISKLCSEVRGPWIWPLFSLGWAEALAGAFKYTQCKPHVQAAKAWTKVGYTGNMALMPLADRSWCATTCGPATGPIEWPAAWCWEPHFAKGSGASSCK